MLGSLVWIVTFHILMYKPAFYTKLPIYWFSCTLLVDSCWMWICCVVWNNMFTGTIKGLQAAFPAYCRQQKVMEKLQNWMAWCQSTFNALLTPADTTCADDVGCVTALMVFKSVKMKSQVPLSSDDHFARWITDCTVFPWTERNHIQLVGIIKMTLIHLSWCFTCENFRMGISKRDCGSSAAFQITRKALALEHLSWFMHI